MKENTPRGFYAQWLVMSNRITSYFTYRYPSRQDELILNANFVRCPHRIGNSILIYGRKNTHFPYQAFVGPDWYCMCVSYLLMIVPTGLFINNIALSWGPGVVFGALFLLCLTLAFFSFTACSDPGIVFIDEGEDQSNLHDLEAPVRKLECGICNIQRPRTASHCFECGVCVENLDHHCPWTGKCIGKKTLKTFYAFLWSLVGLIAYVILVVIITAAYSRPVFDISPKD